MENYKDKIQVAQFFRLMDELFLDEKNTSHTKKRYYAKKERKINRDKITFIISTDVDTANTIRKICKSTRQQPSFLIQTIINDYFNASKIGKQNTQH
jgi:hypothetical protein